MSIPTLITDHDGDLIGDATATFSPCRTYRYALTRRWAKHTIRRCLNFARDWGYGGLLVLNLFALRSTDPAALRTHPDPVGPDNDVVIAEWAGRVSGPIVAAWGVGTLLERDRQVIELLGEYGARLFCLGTTKGGHPRHPLYVRGDTPLVDYPAVTQ